MSLLKNDNVILDKSKAFALEIIELYKHLTSDKKEFKVFPVGMGKSFNCSILNQFSPLLPPKQISKTEEFEKLFNLLSESSRKPEDDPLAKWWNELA